MVLKYISLFSGIGGFEVAIHRLHPRAVCVGYSEIDPQAIAVYEKNFPKHSNLGNVKYISKRDLLSAVKKARGCDLLVAGFPCNDLSSINIGGKGLKGPQSGLFYELLRIIKILLSVNKHMDVVIENNASMAKVWKELITAELTTLLGNIHVVKMNSGDMVVQNRRRYFWTTKLVPAYAGSKTQAWKDVLEKNPCTEATENMISYLNSMVKSNRLEYVKAKAVSPGLYKFVVNRNRAGMSSRWSKFVHHSDTDKPNSSPILSRPYPLIDRRGCAEGTFRIRRFTVKELARLFTFDDDHLPEGTSVNAAYGLFGKAVVVKVVEHVLKHLLK
jgi:DNA-cytosine methyltransferase